MDPNYIKQLFMEIKSKFILPNSPFKDPQTIWKKNEYNKHIILQEPYSVPNVMVWNLTPTEIIAKLFWDETTKTLSNPTKLNPSLVITVDNDYDAIDKEKILSIHDQHLYVRSNIFRILENSSLFPLKPDGTIWIKNIFIIGLPNENHFRRNPLQTNVIVAPVNRSPQKVKNCLKLNDFKKLNMTIETIFQTAILGNCDTLILPDFMPDGDDSYVKNVANIINYQITKYGYYFKYIFISVVTNNQKKLNVFNGLNKYVIQPQNYIQ